MQNTLTELDIMDLGHESYPEIRNHAIYHVLRFLLESPEFNLKKYSGKCSKIFNPPTPIHKVKGGPEHQTLQYLLGTVNIPEASYEDNGRLVDEWMMQMGWGGKDAQKSVGTEKVIFWVGDQLTVDRLRNLAKYRAEDENSYA